MVTADLDTEMFGCLSLTAKRGVASSHRAIAKGTTLPGCCSQPQDEGTGLGSVWG